MNKKLMSQSDNISNEEFKKQLGKFIDITIHESSEDFIEIETQTNGEVKKMIVLYKQPEETMFKQFIDYVNEFDVDKEIEHYTKDERYRISFSMSSSIKDFEDFENRLEEIIQHLNVVAKP